MEPRSIERGNPTRAVERAYESELQWSHAQLSVETRAAVSSAVFYEETLQWSHAQLSVETCYDTRTGTGFEVSFNGATLN